MLVKFFQAQHLGTGEEHSGQMPAPGIPR